MKHWSDIIWKIALALVGFGICIQVAVALITPFINWIIGAVAVSAIVWLLIGVRRALEVKESSHRSLRRGR